MSRAMSTSAVQAVASPQTDKVFLTVLDVYINDNEPLHFVNNTELVTRTFNSVPTIYIPLAFRIVLPSEGENLTSAKLVFDVVDRIMIEELRKATTARVTFSIVLFDTPDVIEAGPFNFKLGSFSYNAQTLEAVLSYGNHLEGRFPRVSKDPYNFPAMF